VEAADGVAVVHCVEGGDFVDAHGWHLEYARYLIHDADAREAVLPLTQIKEGHHGGFFILWGVTF